MKAQRKSLDVFWHVLAKHRIYSTWIQIIEFAYQNVGHEQQIRKILGNKSINSLIA